MGTETSRDEVTLGEAAASDADAVYAIGALCFSDAWRRETVAADMARPHSLYLCARRGAEVLGYACFWFVADEAQLVNLGVRPEARRQGLGARLLEAGLAAAEARGMASMYLEVRVSNLAAQALYRAYGFAVQALRKGVYDLPKEDGYIMARPIPLPIQENP